MLGALVTLALAAPALHHLVLASPLQVPILVQQHSFLMFPKTSLTLLPAGVGGAAAGPDGGRGEGRRAPLQGQEQGAAPSKKRKINVTF